MFRTKDARAKLFWFVLLVTVFGGLGYLSYSQGQFWTFVATITFLLGLSAIIFVALDWIERGE